MIHNDRTLLWETSGNIYNTTFNLPEPVTHYESIEVYASGKESDAGGIHLSKQTFNTQNAKMACDCFGYSPWTTGYNYVLGSDFTISGTQCYCGSSYYMGMSLNSTAYAAGKWVDANAQKMLQPVKIFGIDHKPVRRLTLINGDHGTISASVLTGCEYDTVTLSNTPDADWYFSGYNITGATLTGNKFTFGNSDVTVEGVWADQPQIKTLTLQTDGHGTLTANKVTGYEGDTVTLTPTYNTYYRFSAYQTTGGTINGNTYTFGTATNQTAKANFKVNAFTASGGFDKGSNLTAKTSNSKTVYAQTNYLYATASYKTSNVPAAWYSTSNRWKVTSTVSGYKITLAPKMTFYGSCGANSNQVGGYATGVALIGNTQTQSQTYANHSTTLSTWNYSKSFTSNSTGVNYGCSGRIGANGAAGHYYGSAGYNASLTTGTWTATGYAP